MAWLVAMDGELIGRRFPLDAPCLVGRGPYNHVVLDDTRISRQHAKISPEAGGHVIYDLNSANGTWVNEVQVKRQKLKPDDQVRFGPFSFKFEGDARTGPHVPHPGGKFVEVLTSVGAEPPGDIIDSLDAKIATNPGLPFGLAEMEDADRKLRTLYAFMQSVSTTLDTNELIDRILANLLDVFPVAETAVVYLQDPGTGTMEPRKLRRRREPSPPRHITFSGVFHEEVVGKGRAILSAPLGGKPQRVGASGGVAMHAPILYDGEVHGVLHVRGGDDGPGPFNQHDLDLLTGLAAQAGMALQNARLHQESLLQQRLQQDLLLAEQIQKSFLPRQLPQVAGIEFHTEYRPAYSVGGDFYDVFWLNYDRLGVFIGDVSGKGVSAALLMARISSDLRLAAMAETDPARSLGHVNRIVLERRQPDIFVTGIYFTLEVKTHKILLANAGHLPPFIRRAKEGVLTRLDGGAGTAIGIFDDAEYESTAFTLAPGDTLLLCTDGVLEAASPSGEQFGFDRLEASLKAGSSKTHELAARLLRDVRVHVGEAAQSDDLTLIACGISGGEPTEEELESWDETTHGRGRPE
ncbi:MAG TPA: SpoIIE family protein phosphatase [Polyangia bacterium]